MVSTRRNSDSRIHLIAVGDVQPDSNEPESFFDSVADELGEADILVCQLECTMSEKGVARTDVRTPTHQVSPNNIKALTSGGFNVVTYAGNNNVDYGVEAFLDTIDLLKRHGISVVGAGRNLSEARKPAVVEHSGTKVAFVDFCSILRDGYEATPEKPGLSPIRVKTFYEPLENIHEQPGTPAKTVTIPDYYDFEAAKQTIAEAKAESEIAVACFHWGVHFTHDLAMYQAELAYAAIDAGADLVLGTHPHCLQAIDVYKGKVICYSLGNFAFQKSEKTSPTGLADYLSFYGMKMHPKVPRYPEPIHTRTSVILKCEISDKAISRVSFIPCTFTISGHNDKPVIPAPGSEVYNSIVNLMKSLCDEVGTTFRKEGEEFVVSTEKKESIDTRELLRKRKISYLWLRKLSALSS